MSFIPSQVMLRKYERQWIETSQYVPFHGVDCSRFHPAFGEGDPPPGDRRPNLLFVGRMAIEKSIPELFDVVELVRRDVPDAHLTIVGGGPEAARIGRLAAQHASYCTFVGESFGAELKGWYARASVYVNPSATENFCTTNLEALACGTPLVAAAAGGNREQVVEGVNGFLVKPHVPGEMAARVVEILQSDDLRQRMSLAAREFALKFDTLECARQLEAALRKLIKRKKRVP